MSLLADISERIADLSR